MTDESESSFTASGRQLIQFASPDITDDDVEAVEATLRSGWITTAGECLKLEAELAAFLDASHVVTTSSCTAALEIAVAYLGLPRAARVGVPTWTFVSTALAAVHAGLVPVLLDVDADTLNVDAGSLTRAIDDGLDAVIGVHFGGVALAQPIHDACRAAGLPLIEDAAHALGASDHRGMVAGQGTAGACFSFYATKNLTSAEGGALATDNAELADFARSYRLHGLSADAWARYHPDAPGGYDLLAPGIKGNLSDVLAALARSQLQRFVETQRRRRRLVERYRAHLTTIPELAVVPTDFDPRSADHLLVVLLPPGVDRGHVAAALSDNGISTSVHFQPLHTFHWFTENAELAPGGVPIADAMASRALSLPLHNQLTDAEVDRVCEALAAALAS